jgi:hypothetical protein
MERFADLKLNTNGLEGCDACICCNDVCGDQECFRCERKQKQLESAFAVDSFLAPSTVVIRGGGHRQSSAYSLNTQATQGHHHTHSQSHFRSGKSRVLLSNPQERFYSSCEVERSQGLGLGWMVIENQVFDLTDIMRFDPEVHQQILQFVNEQSQFDTKANFRNENGDMSLI